MIVDPERRKTDWRRSQIQRREECEGLEADVSLDAFEEHAFQKTFS